MGAFRLYDGDSARLLGVHESIEDAYAAAGEHTLAVLRGAGEWVTVEHLIAWLDADGQLELGAEITHAGQPDDNEAPRVAEPFFLAVDVAVARCGRGRGR